MSEYIFEELGNRFQYKPWYIKAWRYRYYIGIPFDAVGLYFYNTLPYLDKELNAIFCDGPTPDSREYLSFKTCWSIAKGSTHHRMGWWYTSAEVGYPNGFAQFAEDDLEDTKEYPAGYLDRLLPLTAGFTLGKEIEPGVVSEDFKNRMKCFK